MANPKPKPRAIRRAAPGVKRDPLYDAGRFASVVGALIRPQPGNTPMARAIPMPARIGLAVGSYVAGYKPARNPKRMSETSMRGAIQPVRASETMKQIAGPFVPSVKLNASQVVDARPGAPRQRANPELSISRRAPGAAKAAPAPRRPPPRRIAAKPVKR